MIESWVDEAHMQAAYFKWVDEACWIIRGTIFAVPNGVWLKDKREANKMVSTGLKRGVSDIIWVLPYDVQFMELKLPNGIQSDDQKLFQQRVEKLGHKYTLFFSLWSLQKFTLDKIKECYG